MCSLPVWLRVSAAMGLVFAASGHLQAEESVAAQAYRILETRCHSCHGVNKEVVGLDILDHGTLLADRGEKKKPYIKANSPPDSKVWQVIRDGIMPPNGKSLPTEEQEALKAWIEQGAPAFDVGAGRKSIDEAAVLTAIRDYLFDAKRGFTPAQRRTKRFFSLANLWNNASISEANLRLYRAALVKLVNSLSRKDSFVPLATIDPAQAVFVVDLQDAGWDESGLWRKILAEYPYGLEPDSSPLDVLQQDISKAIGSENAGVCYLRADWFVAKASRSPRYEALLQLPSTLEKFEKEIVQVDSNENFLRNNLKRAAFAESGVSKQNRVLERHVGKSGTVYWKSFDFRASAGKGNPLVFPLGPQFTNNPFNETAFEHAGGEMIFTLPNGLHAYFLTDGEGKFIAKGPVDIVWDRNNISGNPEIVNGLSCIGCHRKGINPFVDRVRTDIASAFGKAEREKISELYPTAAIMQPLIERDARRYQDAVSELLGPYLKVGANQDKAIDQFLEPIAALSQRYDQDVNLADLASEFYQEPSWLKGRIEQNDELLRLVRPLLRGGSVDRGFLESQINSVSEYQKIAKTTLPVNPIVILPSAQR